jgi:hypothetical protein
LVSLKGLAVMLGLRLGYGDDGDDLKMVAHRQ